MSESKEALRRRFRAALAERTRSICSLVEENSKDPTGKGRQELLGQLHTLKGEGRMLGMELLSSLCHAVEEALLADEYDWGALRGVADAMSLAMAETTTDVESQDLLATAAQAMGVDVALSSADEDEVSGVQDVPDAPATNQWIQVEAATVQRLGESLAALSVGFSEHLTSLKNHHVNSQEQLFKAEELRARLQDALSMALDLRLTSIEPLLASLAAHVRVLCPQRGKRAAVSVESSGVRVEREVLERLREPLLHLCTNAVVHGLEAPEARGEKSAEASIVLRAHSTSSGVVVSVTDDGRGIDASRGGRQLSRAGEPDAGQYDFLFESGFSTHGEADEVAGRGVGLAVVKRQVESMGGRVLVESQAGLGTSFQLNVPALLTQQNVVSFQVGSSLYGLSAQDVRSIIPCEDQSAQSIRYGGEVVPLRSLSQLLGVASPEPENHILILQLDRVWALRVGKLWGNFEVIRRAASTAFRQRTGVEASAQLEDGRLLLLLSTSFLRSALAADHAIAQPSRSNEADAPRYAPKVLVVDDSVVVRDLIAEILVTAGYQVTTAEDGVHALQVIESFKPGLVVSDIEMPQMDGFALLGAIREKYATLPVILLTARSSVKDRQRASSAGANAYVTKGDFERDTLVATIERYFPRTP